MFPWLRVLALAAAKIVIVLAVALDLPLAHLHQRATVVKPLRIARELLDFAIFEKIIVELDALASFEVVRIRNADQRPEVRVSGVVTARGGGRLPRMASPGALGV